MSRGKCPGGKCPGVSVWGGKCPGGICQEGRGCPVTPFNVGYLLFYPLKEN